MNGLSSSLLKLRLTLIFELEEYDFGLNSLIKHTKEFFALIMI